MRTSGHVGGFEPIETVPLVGGEPCFDFTNTASGRTVGPLRERLGTYGDLLTWAERVELLSAAQSAELAVEARRRPDAALAVVASARAIREVIYRVFSAVAAGRAPEDSDLDEFNRLVAEAGARRRLETRSGAWTWTWSDGQEPLAWPLWPVIESAADMLTRGDVQRIKECHANDCTWLFYDASRNRSRRWCEMRDCGNAEKQRRHYRRKRSGAGEEAGRPSGSA